MKIYNSMTRQKEEFIPLHENTVNMYIDAFAEQKKAKRQKK